VPAKDGNFVLRDKKVSFSFQKPFDLISLKNSVVLNSSKKKGALSLVPTGHAEIFFKNVNNSQLNVNWLCITTDVRTWAVNNLHK